jgi:hypothetical protein
VVLNLCLFARITRCLRQHRWSAGYCQQSFLPRFPFGDGTLPPVSTTAQVQSWAAAEETRVFASVCSLLSCFSGGGYCGQHRVGSLDSWVRQQRDLVFVFERLMILDALLFRFFAAVGGVLVSSVTRRIDRFSTVCCGDPWFFSSAQGTRSNPQVDLLESEP